MKKTKIKIKLNKKKTTKNTNENVVGVLTQLINYHTIKQENELYL